MRPRKPLLPRLESLEIKTVMSAGVSSVHPAVVGLDPGPEKPRLLSLDDATDLASARAQKLELSGQTQGFYTSRFGPPDKADRFHLNSSGAITPIGAAVVTGTFETFRQSQGGGAAGTLTIVGPKGKLYLNLTESSAATETLSTDQSNAINPGGPMIADAKASSGSTVGDPIILVNNFQFEIVRGAGEYSHARGTGTLQIETTPGLSTPTGPGTYSSSLATTAGLGRAILTFDPA
jgi:hypothetical protein